MPLDRRTFLATGAAAFAAGAVARKSFAQPIEGSRGMKAISSANGLKAVEKAYELMTGNADTLDAAIAGVQLVEDDPDDLTVGYGGLPNENGVVELDAAVMHGPTHKAGAVASLQSIRHPAAVARMVMKRTDHVLLVGEGGAAVRESAWLQRGESAHRQGPQDLALLERIAERVRRLAASRIRRHRSGRAEVL